MFLIPKTGKLFYLRLYFKKAGQYGCLLERSCEVLTKLHRNYPQLINLILEGEKPWTHAFYLITNFIPINLSYLTTLQSNIC